MALINESGNYLKITDVNITTGFYRIQYSMYENQQVRNELALVDTKAAKDLTAQTISFKNAIEGYLLISDGFIFSQDEKLTTKDNLITGGYLTLKVNGFEDWIDG